MLYGGTAPYGHIVNAVTSLLGPLFLVPAKRPYAFLLENPVNAATPSIPNRFNPSLFYPVHTATRTSYAQLSIVNISYTDASLLFLSYTRILNAC